MSHTDSEVSSLVERYGDSRSLSELFLHSDGWDQLVSIWADHPHFKTDIQPLIEAGLVEVSSDDPASATLAPIGQEIARRADESRGLWNRHNDRDKFMKPE